jgi:uroporphyrinogen decarboxylase
MGGCMAKMTSRERVLAAINHREPDRVPLDIGGGGSTSIVVEGYEKLKRYLGTGEETGDTQYLSKNYRIARIDERVMRQLGADCRSISLKPPMNWKPPISGPGTYKDIWGITWKEVHYAENGFYHEVAEYPLADAGIGDLDKYPWPDPDDPGYTAGLARDAKTLYEETEYAILGDSRFKSLWELGYSLRGFDKLLMDLVLDPLFFSALMSRLLEINIAGTGRFLDAVGPYIQVFRAADDLATQNGLLFSPELYRKLLKPVYKKYFDFIKSKTDARIVYHSCGNIVNLLDDLIEIGVDIINPVQVSAMGDTAELKRRFGERLVFWGGVDTQHVMPHGSVRDVESEVRRRIQDLGPGGGYVAAAVHAIQPDVPPENIVAMTEAVRKFGNYPLVPD